MIETDTTTTRPLSVFAKHEAAAFPYRYVGTIHVDAIAGGVPTNEHVAEGWLRTKLAAKDDLIREAVAQTMAERGVTADEAAKLVEASRHLNGFKRDRLGLYIEGRQLKAGIKEAVSVAVAAGKLEGRGWGRTNKGLLSFVAEHVFVTDDRLHLLRSDSPTPSTSRHPDPSPTTRACPSRTAADLPTPPIPSPAHPDHPIHVTEPTGIVQRFVSTFRGTGIQLEEYVENARFDFTVISDHLFKEEQWALIWLTGQQQGIGASRSQGFGRYVVTRWERIA